MSRYATIDFNLTTGTEKVIFVPGCSRFDIEVDGAVLVQVSPNGVDKTVSTITDTAENFYWAGSFKIEATGGTAIGRVTAVTSDYR